MNFKKKDQRTLDYAIFACFCLYESIPTCTLKIEQQRPLFPLAASGYPSDRGQIHEHINTDATVCALTCQGDNDTSVTRGPAMMKAGG